MELEGKNVLVTGGCGFIGSHLAGSLSRKNAVTVFDNLASGKEPNISGMKLKFIKSDIRDSASLGKAIQGIDIVFHEAANVFVQRSVEDPVYDSEVNVGGTLNVLEACRKSGVSRLVFASSCAVYGDPKLLPVSEALQTEPRSPYGMSKFVAESYCRLYSELYGIQTVCLRYFNVYGPRQDPSSPYSGVISIFSKNISGGKPIVVYGDGSQTRDFVNVRDVVKANLLAATAKHVSGKIFNIGTGKQTSLKQLISAIEKASGKKAVVSYKDARSGDILHSQADISIARSVLGFAPSVLLEEGLKELMK